MRKILMVATVPITLSGFFLPFAKHFRAQGWQVDGMACEISKSSDCVAGFDRVWDVQWSRNPLDPRNLLATPQKIRDIVSRERYDIIHVHTPVAAFVTRYALKDLRKQLQVKVIYTAHGFHFYTGGNPLKNAVFIGLEKLAGGWTDYLVTVNHEDYAATSEQLAIPPACARYIPSAIGVDLNYYNLNLVSAADVERVRQEFGISPETPLLLSIAEFTARKCHSDTIRAFAKLDRATVHLAIAGSGPLLESMKQLAVELGVADRIHFLGRRGDIPTLMKAATANILASKQEGLPRCVLESLALELPTIGTKIRGTQDLLEGGCGILVELGDIEGLAQAMAQILDRPDEAKAMAQRGRERVSAYDLQSIIKLHEDLYGEALGDKV
jgi:glycosyltransferase involved in cell wall biosynthesis